MTGYRVGAIVAGNAFIEHAAKAMDCIAICAPRIGQEAAHFGLGHLDAIGARPTRTCCGRAARRC